MTFLTYTSGIPLATNNPSVDQPNMKINNDSNSSIWTQDHYGFNNNNGGIHKQTRMPTLASVPGGRIVNEGTLYTKITNSAGTLYYVPDNTTNEYQLTRTISASFASFATNPGWTFLPGGLLMQYGSGTTTTVSSGPNGTASFSVSGFTVYSLNISVVEPSNSRRYVKINAVTTSGFTIWVQDDSGTNKADTFYWTAIGK